MYRPWAIHACIIQWSTIATSIAQRNTWHVTVHRWVLLGTYVMDIFGVSNSGEPLYSTLSNPDRGSRQYRLCFLAEVGPWLAKASLGIVRDASKVLDRESIYGSWRSSQAILWMRSNIVSKSRTKQCYKLLKSKNVKPKFMAIFVDVTHVPLPGEKW